MSPHTSGKGRQKSGKDILSCKVYMPKKLKSQVEALAGSESFSLWMVKAAEEKVRRDSKKRRGGLLEEDEN